MPSIARPYGLIPQKHTGGLPFAGATIMIPIASGYTSNIAYGDVVRTVAGQIQKEVGTTAVTATGVIGVFLGCAYTDPGTKWRVMKTLWPANTVTADAIAYVCDDPAAIFQVQASGSVAAAALGTNIGLIQNAVDTAYGVSRVSAGAPAATTNTLPLRIVGFVNGTDQVAGDAYTDILVRWNAGMHAYSLPLGA